MNWIKVTPETMPPDMEPVIVTVDDKYNPPKYTWGGRTNKGKWELLIEAGDVYASIKEWILVTHWMPYPEPAEDLGSVNMCNYHDGDEAIFWEDENNNAFVDSYGEMLLTVSGHEIQFRVTHCPMCGEKLK